MVVVDVHVGAEQRRPILGLPLARYRRLHGHQVLVRAPLCRQRGQLGLDGEAELEDVVELGGVVAHPAVPAGEELVRVAHPGAAVRPSGRDDVSGALEGLEGEAQGHAGNAQMGAQVSLGRKPIAGTQLPREDHGPKISDRAVARCFGGEHYVLLGFDPAGEGHGASLAR